MKRSIPRRHHVAPRRRRGSILIASIILVVIAGVMALSWLGFVTHSMQAAVRDRERLASLYAAEAGVEMVIDWFNNPDFHAEVVDAWDAPDPRNFGVLVGIGTQAATSGAMTQVTTTGTTSVVAQHSTQIVYYAKDSTGSLTKVKLSLDSAEAPLHPEPYELRIPELRTNYKYGIFEPFVRDYVKDFEGIPMDAKTGKRMWDDTTKEWINGYGPHDLIPLRFSFFYPGINPMQPINREDPKDVSIRSKIPSMVVDLTSFGDNLPEAVEHVGFRFGRDERNAIEDGLTFARLESLTLIHPADLLPPDGSLPQAFGPFTAAEMQQMGADLAAVLDDRRIAGPIATKVIATGISRSGIRTTVESYLVENIIPDVGANAALMSQNGVAFTSRTNIRWGEILTYGDHVLQNSWKNHYPLHPEDGDLQARRAGIAYYDPWFAHRITASKNLTKSYGNGPVFFKSPG
jgi:Tfp pilus assembly protein PilX